jgi:protein SCO1/2
MRWPYLLAAALIAAPVFAHGEKPVPPSAAVTKQPHMSVIRQAPSFSLVDHRGRNLSLEELRGQPVLIAFIYTGCKTACPILSLRMARLQEKLERARLRATLLSVTVDPQTDDAATLGKFAKGFNARAGWHFLRAEPARLAPVLASYEEWVRRTPEGEIDHPARLHLIDGAGRVREIYSLAFFDEEQAFIDIMVLNQQLRR